MKHASQLLLIVAYLMVVKTNAQTPINLSNPSICGLNLPLAAISCSDDGVYNSPDLFNIQVTNAPGVQLGTDVYLQQVRLIIKHNWPADLEIRLTSPGGKTVLLASDNGGGDDDFGNPNDVSCDSAAVFLSSACLSVEDGLGPFLPGPYRPLESFYEFNDNATNPIGTWRLSICDDHIDDAGILEFVELVFAPMTCLPALDLAVTGLDTTSAWLTWNAGEPCGPAIIEFGLAGFTPGTDSLPGAGGTVVFADCAPFLLTGLPPDAEVDIYVRRYCPFLSGFSGNSCGLTVRSGCQPPPATIVSTFDDENLCGTLCGNLCEMTGFWRNGPNGDFDWLVHTGATPTGGTGPESDVDGSGKYVYTETTGANCAVGAEAHLLSGCVEVNKMGTDTCHMSFNYHMFGTSIGSLRLEVSSDGGFTWNILWQKAGNQGNQWNKVYLPFAAFNDGDRLQFRFVAVKGNGFRGDIALDHIVFYGSKNLGYPDLMYFADNDGDGYGHPGEFWLSCTTDPPAGFVQNDGDCMDNDPMINPGRPEIACDGIDNNCNGPEDDLILDPPAAQNDTICSGFIPTICATPANPDFFIVWYGEPEGEDSALSIGNCYSPDLPPNNTAAPVVYRFYAEETNFNCHSGSRAEVEVVVFPDPDIFTPDEPAICPGESFNLNSLDIRDNHFTGATYTFHSGFPATAGNVLTSPVVMPSGTTTYYFKGVSPRGCEDTDSVTVQVKEAPLAAFDPADSLSLCKESSTLVTASATGGTGPYTYFWSTGSSNAQITVNAGAVSGITKNYQVTVTDQEGCANTGNLKVTTTNSIDSLKRIVRNVTDCEGSDGQIILIPLNGLPPFSYQWTGGNGTSGSGSGVQDTIFINGLSQASYRVTITDNSQAMCSFVLRNILVQGPAAVVNSTSVKDVTCAGAADGEICVNVTGNNPVFHWSNNETTSCIDNLPGGQYSVTITDGPCITTLDKIVVEEPSVIVTRADLRSPTCAQNNDGSITVVAFGGTPPYEYQWSNQVQTPQNAQIAAGSYIVTVSDAQDCFRIDTFQLQAPDLLQLVVDSLRDMSCSGIPDGFVQVRAIGGTPPYHFTWASGSNSPVRFGLAAGTYTANVTDYNNCTAQIQVQVKEPLPVTVNVAVFNRPLCQGDATGSIQVAASGGTPPYTYFWAGGQSGNSLADLPVGAYSVTARDSRGCLSLPLTVQLLPQTTINLGIAVVPPPCVGPQTGQIALTPTGVGPFTYHWDSGATNPVLTGIGVGNHGVEVMDGQGCILDTVIAVTAPQVFQANLFAEQPSCYGVADGLIQTVLLATGTPPIQYAWNDGPAATKDRASLAPGDYQLTISDGIGCRFISDTISLEWPERFRIDAFDLGNALCHGETNGYIETVLTGGTLPYSVNWVGQGSGQSGIYDLAPGTYRLLASDARGCPIDTNFVIAEPPPLSVSFTLTFGATCDPSALDSLVANAAGGTQPYQYEWNNGKKTKKLINMPAGDYGVTVTDANGCMASIPSIKVREEVPALKLDTFYLTPITCFGEHDASMTAVISGGSGMFRYHFSPTYVLTGVSADSVTVDSLGLFDAYRVTVTDLQTGCQVVSQTLHTSEPPLLSIALDHLDPVNCAGSNDGGIDLHPVGGVSPYDFIWTNEAGDTLSLSEDLNGVGPGHYYLELTDANGCSVYFDDEVPQVNQPIQVSNISIAPVACYGAHTGSIQLSVSGGKLPYHYTWSNGMMTQDIANLEAGAYTLTLTDGDNCQVVLQDFEVTGPDSPIDIEEEVLDPTCAGEQDGAIRLDISGGESPYTLTWWNGGVIIPNAHSDSLINLKPGKYTFRVTDNLGCSVLREFNLYNPAPILLNIQTIPPMPPDYADGRIVVTPSGGTAPYEFLWSTGSINDTLEMLGVGTYQVTVTDANDCESVGTVMLVDAGETLLADSGRLYPNPAGDLVNLELHLNRSADLDIELFDWTGRRITAFRKIHQDGVIPIPLDGLATGLYLVRARIGLQTVFVGRLVKGE